LFEKKISINKTNYFAIKSQKQILLDTHLYVSPI